VVQLAIYMSYGSSKVACVGG